MRNNTPRTQLLRALLQSVDDSGPQQLMKLTGLVGQTIGEAVRSQLFGLSTVPPKDAEALMLAIGGGADRFHALGVEHPKYRPTNQPDGSTVLYDAYGDMVSIVQKEMRIVHAKSITVVAPVVEVDAKTSLTLKVGKMIVTAESDVSITAKTIELNGQVTLGGPAGAGQPVAKLGSSTQVGGPVVGNVSTNVKVV